MRVIRTLLISLLICILGLSLIIGAVYIVMLSLISLQRTLTPAAFIALSYMLLISFCLHLALKPDGWLFKREMGWRLGLRGWANLSAQLLIILAVLLSAKLMMYAVLASYPDKFWLVAVTVGVLTFGAAVVADRRKNLRP